MNQQISHAANQPDSHTPDEPTSHPRRKKKDHVLTWISLASAATAIVAAAISGYQVHIAGQQNTEAQQTQLVTLTALIAQQFAEGHSAARPLSTYQGAARSERISVYGQAASVLIDDLKGNGVASTEYVEVARALDYTGATTEAIPYYKDALTAPPNAPYTRAQALRYLGSLYYGLGSNVIAHRYMLQSTKVYRGHPLEYKSSVVNSTVQGYEQDAYWQVYINCGTAAADMEAARRAIGSYSLGPIAQSWVDTVEKSYKSKCKGSG